MADTYGPAKDHLKEHGWTRIESVLSKEEAETALEHLWNAKEKAEARGDATYLDFLDPNPSNVRVFYLMELDKIFRDLISNPVAVSSNGCYLHVISGHRIPLAPCFPRSKASLYSNMIVAPYHPWKDVWALNIIWCLTDVTKENGATLYIPGSNKWVTRDEVPPNAPEFLVPFEAKAGDILVMDGRVWHTSGSNITEDQDRALLFGYYTAGFMRQQVNWTAKLPKEIQDSLDPELHTWLGLGPAGNIGVTGDTRFMSVQYPNSKVPSEEKSRA